MDGLVQVMSTHKLIPQQVLLLTSIRLVQKANGTGLPGPKQEPVFQRQCIG
jgi:hypothetical protein